MIVQPDQMLSWFAFKTETFNIPLNPFPIRTLLKSSKPKSNWRCHVTNTALIKNRAPHPLKFTFMLCILWLSEVRKCVVDVSLQIFTFTQSLIFKTFVYFEKKLTDDCSFFFLLQNIDYNTHTHMPEHIYTHTHCIKLVWISNTHICVSFYPDVLSQVSVCAYNFHLICQKWRW